MITKGSVELKAIPYASAFNDNISWILNSFLQLKEPFCLIKENNYNLLLNVLPDKSFGIQTQYSPTTKIATSFSKTGVILDDYSYLNTGTNTGRKFLSYPSLNIFPNFNNSANLTMLSNFNEVELAVCVKIPCVQGISISLEGGCGAYLEEKFYFYSKDSTPANTPNGTTSIQLASGNWKGLGTDTTPGPSYTWSLNVSRQIINHKVTKITFSMLNSSAASSQTYYPYIDRIEFIY